MLKAASLMYAIFVLLIISILCYGILLVFSLNLRLDTYFENRSALLIEQRSALEEIKANFKEIQTVTSGTIQNENKAFFSKYNIKKWGVLTLVKLSTYSKNDSIKSNYFIGRKRRQNMPALYLRENDEPLKISGTTKIEGDVYVSQEGIKKVRINNHITHKPTHIGKRYLSNKVFFNLKDLDDTEEEFLETIDAQSIEDTLIVSFNQDTKIVRAATAVENIKLKGNIILQSKDTLVIDRYTYLEDVIIKAPKVIFKQGFKGNAQVLSSHIILEKGVVLTYPSALITKGDTNQKSTIICDENTNLQGVIYMLGDGLKTLENREIQLKENSKIQGDVVCDGKLSIKGTIEGSVFASLLFYEDISKSYTNLIHNAKILSNKLPLDYFQIAVDEKFENDAIVIIKKN